ncbi:MAG TPA: hypothetical protein VFQ53_03495 [Kofleriaceae bacterium]|nr:hypothetical protein [Kofleriaceae bacterium]
MKPTNSLAIERTGDTYVARDAGGIVWILELRLDMRGTPFRDELVWPAADVVAIGGGPEVHFVARATGGVIHTLSLDDDFFGELAPAPDDVLYILGWRHVVAVDRSLAVRWVSRDVAVDGITWRGHDGDRLLLSAELDPPGGWVDIALDAATGRAVRAVRAVARRLVDEV